MKCKNCDGSGIDMFESECRFCGGMGVVEPLTEQEWLQTATTEQLAEKLTDFSFWLVVTIPTEDRREKVRKRIVEWLKQPHREE